MNVSNSLFSETHNTKGLLGDYEEIDDKLYQEKLKKDEVEYAKIKEKFETRTIDNYNAEAKGEDYYHIYRIVERLIRANNLDFTNWRIGIQRANNDSRPGYKEWNYIVVPTSLYGNFMGNDSAIAFAIAHVMAHALLGHQERRAKAEANITRIFDITGGLYIMSMHRRSLIESKNTEFAADIEALNLVAKAGYDIGSAMKYLKFFESSDNIGDYGSGIPNIKKRIKNCNTAIKLIPIDELKKIGTYNIYNSNVLYSELSSDRESFTIVQQNTGKIYHPETNEEYYLRCGYGAYVNSEYKKSVEYFEKYFKLNTNNSNAYLYASYANSELYKCTNNNKFKNKANKYLKKAKSISLKI